MTAVSAPAGAHPAATVRAPRLLQATAFVSTLDRFAIAPMLLAIAGSMHVPLGTVVAAASVYYLAYGVMQPVWGLVAGRLGLVRTIRGTLAAGAVATGASALVSGPAALVATRAVAGAMFSAAIPGTLVYVGETVPARGRQQAVTDLMAGVALGTAAATAGAGWVAAAVDWRLTFVATAVAALVLAVALHGVPPPSRPAGAAPAAHPLRAVATSPAALGVLALAFGEGALLLGGLTFLAPAAQAHGVSAGTAGLLVATYGVAVLAGARVVGRLSRRVPPARLVVAGGASGAVAFLVVATSRSPGAVVAACLFLGAAWALMHSTMQTWATEVVPSARSITVSLFAGSLFAGSALGSALAGPLVGRGAYGTVFLAAGLLLLPLALVGGVARHRWGNLGGPGCKRL